MEYSMNKSKIKFWLLSPIFIILAIAINYACWLVFAAVFGPQNMFIGVGVGYALPIACALVSMFLPALKGKHLYLKEKTTTVAIVKILITTFVIAIVHGILTFLPIYVLLARKIDFTFFVYYYGGILVSFAVVFTILSVCAIWAWFIAKKNQPNEEILQEAE